MQSNFFDPSQPKNEGPKAPQTPDRPAAKRVFLYDNQVFEDPGPEYSNQDVLNFLSQTYPELGNGTWTSRTLPDSAAGAVEEITFVKVTGEKGNDASSGSGAGPFELPLDRLLLTGPVSQPVRRIFLYDNQLFEDPGPEYSNQDVLNFLSSTYLELGNGTWTSRTLPDDGAGPVEEITFVKVTGEKGSGAADGSSTVTSRQLITALDQLTPSDIEAITLLDQITGLETDDTSNLNAARLLAMTPAIEAALQQAERIANNSQRIVRQCLELTPIPHPKVPLGF